jgi:hypothetical protein
VLKVCGSQALRQGGDQDGAPSASASEDGSDGERKQKKQKSRKEKSKSKKRKHEKADKVRASLHDRMTGQRLLHSSPMRHHGCWVSAQAKPQDAFGKYGIVRETDTDRCRLSTSISQLYA